ncbi:MAG TPA: hypothetical protein EYH11_04805 [Sulfurimonas autotrophica]|nr:hypothetical protein [Sulfurimonas autotrophica]
MRLENTLALIHGELINTPCINSFNNVVLDAKAVKRGDLFIAFDENSIEDAIFNGAYGVIFDKPTQITDNEIAWIKVANLEDSLKRLLRFRLISKEITAYSCDEITLKLAIQIVTEPNFIVLHGSLQSIFKELYYVENSTTVLFSPTLTPADLFTSIKELPKSKRSIIDIIRKTLFETSFIYNNVFYERELIAPLFIPYLERLLYLLQSLKIEFRLRKFTQIDHFEAVFVNRNFEIKEFGNSDRVLIFEKSISFIEDEIGFLQKHAPWAKIIYIVPFSSKGLLSTATFKSENIFFYTDSKELKTILHANSFHFALIGGIDRSILEELSIKQTQLTLDF